MTWDLVGSHVDLNGYLSFTPDIQYWLNANNTYRVVFIQVHVILHLCFLYLLTSSECRDRTRLRGLSSLGTTSSLMGIHGAESTGMARLAALKHPTVCGPTDFYHAALVDILPVAYEGRRRRAAHLPHAVERHARRRERLLGRSTPFWCNTVAQSKDVLYDGMYQHLPQRQYYHDKLGCKFDPHASS